MTEWTSINIQLLLKDCCHSILLTALKILNGLVSFHTEVIRQPKWPSVNPKYTTLYLFKIYLLHIFFNHDTLLEFFDLPQETVLLLGAKIITKKNSDTEVNKILNSLLISDIDDNNEVEYEFIAETLSQFEKILKTMTITLWSNYIALTKCEMAVNNLKTKMLSLATENCRQQPPL
jgi:hypothetical protein